MTAIAARQSPGRAFPDGRVVLAAAAVVADLAFAGRYLPDGPEPRAGDFWDVLELPDGRVGLKVGDVADHGVQAVGSMRRLRAKARAYATQQLAPTVLLARLDWLWYGEYDPATDVLVHASAGHSSPAAAAGGDLPVLLGLTAAPPLGSGLAHAQARERRDVLAIGGALVAYTDGLVERRQADIGDGLDRLAGSLARAAAATEQAVLIAQTVLEALLPDPERAEDDVCLLVVRRLA